MSLLQSALSILVSLTSISEAAADCCGGNIPSGVNVCYKETEYCLKSISGDAEIRNQILEKFAVTFISTTGVDATTGVPAGPIDNSAYLNFLDNSKIKTDCQKDLYIRIIPTAVPVFDPTLSHVLVFTPKPETTLEDYTLLYSFYALRTDLPAMAITASVNTTDYSLNIIFPANYSFDGQTIVARRNTYATSTKVVDNTTATPPVYTITVTSEILLGQVVGEVTPLAAPTTMVFPSTFRVLPPETSVILAGIKGKIESNCTGSFLTDCQVAKLRCHIRQVDVIARISNTCARPKKCATSKKCALYKYFAFVTSCLSVIPSKCLENEGECSQKVVAACSKAEDPYSVFCAIMARLLVSISIEARCSADLLNSFFETVVGLNVFCHPHKGYEKLYSLSGSDTECVRSACPEEVALYESADGAASAVGVDQDNEENDNSRGSSSSKSALARHKWTIIIVVSVLVVGSVTAFMLY